MQTVACDISGKLVDAAQARRRKDYYCLECHGTVRKRSSLFRRPHFYHLCQDTICHPQERSLLHQEIQDFIQQQFPDAELELESFFPQIGRRADIVWPDRRLIFEVQCSPISRWEIAGRMEDYGRLGYEVIWVLLADRYFRRHLTEVEQVLFHAPYFFITKKAFCFTTPGPVKEGRRKWRAEKVPVCFDPFDPKSITRDPKKRIQLWSSQWIEQFMQVIFKQASR